MAHIPNKVQYRRYNHIDMSDFHPDLKYTSFIKSPANAEVDLYQQYVHYFVIVLGKRATLVSGLTQKDSAFCPHHQIARCNAVVNKDKSDNCSN